MNFEQILRKMLREELTSIVRQEFDRRGVGEKDPEGYLSVEEAAQYLSVEPNWVRMLARSGKLEGHRAEGSTKWKFTKKDLDAYLLRGRKGIRPVEPENTGQKAFLEINKRKYKVS